MDSRTFVLWLAALLIGSVAQGQSAPGPDPTVPAIGGVTRGSFRSVLFPAVEINLPAKAAGVLEKIYLPEGEPVTAGQAIMSLDSEQERAELEQAEAAVRGTKADWERAAAEYERIVQVRGDNIYSEKQISELKAQSELAHSRYDQSVAAVAIARVKLTNRSIVSPITGRFLRKFKEAGEAVERYETVAHVVDVTNLEMTVYCDASYFSLFKTGQRVDVRVFKSSADQSIVSGLVVHTDPIIDPSSGTFRVKVKIEPSDKAIAGLSAVLIPPATVPIHSPRQP